MSHSLHIPLSFLMCFWRTCPRPSRDCPAFWASLLPLCFCFSRVLIVLAAACLTCIFTHFHSLVPSILVHPSVSVHFILLFPGLAFASLTGVVVVMVIRVLSDVLAHSVVFGYTDDTHIHTNLSISQIKLQIFLSWGLCEADTHRRRSEVRFSCRAAPLKAGSDALLKNTWVWTEAFLPAKNVFVKIYKHTHTRHFSVCCTWHLLWRIS